MKPDGTDAKVMIEEKKIVDYEWSPDGKYVAVSRLDGSFAYEIYIAPTVNPDDAKMPETA